ncbi:MAG: hypothetical protein ACRC28_01760 [Clostridium sp.]|uniref:hypothetical protein n=1 Tax=Clostridium sp. TaxID=1506 RepID=UPI003F3EC93D
MMQREIVVKKKAPVIAIVLIVITCMLYLHQGLKFIKFRGALTLEVCNIVILVVTCIILLREIVSCSTSYKYSVIADKLIVNKIFMSKEKNLASVRISDIEYIGKKSDAPKIRAKFIGSFVCSLLNNNTCVCIYKKNNEYYKFSFEPSNEFVCKLNRGKI